MFFRSSFYCPWHFCALFHIKKASFVYRQKRFFQLSVPLARNAGPSFDRMKKEKPRGNAVFRFGYHILSDNSIQSILSKTIVAWMRSPPSIPLLPPFEVVMVCRRYPFAACALMQASSSVRLPDPVPMNFSFSVT